MSPQCDAVFREFDNSSLSLRRYALKMYVLTGEQPYLDIWNEAYAAIMNHSRSVDGHWVRLR